MPTVTSKGKHAGDGNADPVSNQSLAEPFPDHLVWHFPFSTVASVDHPTHSATLSSTTYATIVTSRPQTRLQRKVLFDTSTRTAMRSMTAQLHRREMGWVPSVPKHRRQT